ncbi:S1C family serine protease [Oceanobacillus manasiensis]|uniref:S1C family serine protease n=1 Tax=Oceanobacillus manasiensis TaxID=586413 RepID=UPI000A0019B8|nr:trypsin-like peptidase domain-containing protein [Oceanobacillus manasiensis]
MDQDKYNANHQGAPERNDGHNIPERELEQNSGAETEDTLTQPEHPVHHESTPPEQRSENVKPTKNKSGLHFILGGISGGIVSVALIIALIMTNIIPINTTSSASEGDGNSSSSTPDIVQTLASDEATLSSSIEETSKAVVGVSNMQQQSVWTDSQEAGTGSGIVYKKENGKAYVVTNQHVVEGAKEVEVVLDDEEHINATVLGTDALTDLAVLEVDGEKIDTVASIGSSEDLKVGETVVAIGNPLGIEFANTITKGIVSGLNRSVSMDTNGDQQADWVTEVIQTDAAINPGNSGGALVNGNGEVIGINSMKIARQEVEGIGFAIPMDTALPIMDQLEQNGEIERPLIGISTASLSQVPAQFRNEIELPEKVEGGMVIADVQAGSSAESAGLQRFDVITQINGNAITSILELRKFLYSDAAVGDTVEIEYYRDGEQKTAKVTLQAGETEQ